MSENSTVDIVVVGSLNTDLTTRVLCHPEPGETVPGSPLAITPGGKGANQAVAAARLGANVAMVGRVGADSHGDALLDALRADGVDTTDVLRDAELPTGTAMITVADTGENSIIVSSAANSRLAPSDVARARTQIAAAQVISVVLEIPEESVVAAARTAGEAGTRLVVNLSPVASLPDDVMALADPLIVNQHEARQLLDSYKINIVGQRGTDHAAALLGLGVRSAVVTFGGEGAAVATAGGTRHIDAVPAEPVDTTGAGDAFAAAVAWRLSHGDTLTAAAEWAACVSARSVQHPGAQPSYPTLDALASM